MSEPVFPQIIFDYVLDQLSDDRETLSNCILVCRDWVKPCRRPLFSQMILNRNNWQAFRDYLHLYARYLMVKEPASSYIRSETMAQAFRDLPLRLWELLQSRWQPKPILPVEDLIHPTAFTQVTFLAVQLQPPFPFTHIPELQSFLRGLTSAFPRVRTLEIQDDKSSHRAEEMPMEELFQFICSFPELEVLTVGSLYHHYGVIGNVQRFQPPPGLHTLNLLHGRDLDPPVLVWLNSIECLPQITTLRVRPSLEIPLWNLEFISKLILKQGHSIRHLQFDDALGRSRF